MNNQSNYSMNKAILIFIGLLMVSSSALATPTRVAILPFNINAEKDLSFLQEGILDMLASRLAWKDKVGVISKNETRSAVASVTDFEGESRALLVGGKLHADYVLFGSLTVFGESLSIDAKMVDVSGQQKPLPFFAQTRSMGEVVPQVNQFASNINATVFGRAPAQSMSTAATSPEGTPSGAPMQAPQQAYNPRMHPEKLLQSGVQNEGQDPVMGQTYQQTPNPAFIATAPAYGAGDAANFWKSQRFKSLITGIGIGDVDKDGLLETVIVTANEVLVYRNQNGRMARVAELETINTNQYLGVDVGDINGNGYAEIFVSSIGPRKDAYNSFVLEYDGSEYRRIASDLPWHFRIVNPGAEGDFLVAQKEPPADGNLRTQPIFRMNWDGSAYTPGNLFLQGQKANVFGVAAGNLISETETSIIGYSEYDRILIFRPGGAMEWKSTNAYGGSLSNFHFPGKKEIKDTGTHFFAMRLRTADLDHNGKVELIAAANNEISNRIMQNQRAYSNSRLVSLSWNGMGMTENWKTNEISGRISDYFIGDFDNDGTNELVAAVIRKEGSLAFADAESVIVSYTLKVK
ncbi:hypothetical protein DSCO28_72480 (plasmid) [Desulfosarcina ovata subsp. sediminis]|uniref:FlgO domain-containing protein n=1 Tax=Desulfosarcina ovata subsp. sediminis TaxID=885957 RepID=A0A5K8A2B3_9BACT|nr:VCBS repeat-containing protein [Desulfosarcina ovata]BBO86682.1 hypothetical protein DSCO28_72480 [Desulfosarcina ovata subsp. sediminis]